MVSVSSLLAGILAVGASSLVSAEHAPEQIHLAYSGVDTEMMVSWVELDSCSKTYDVSYAPKSNRSNENEVRFHTGASTAEGSSVLFSTGMASPICVWTAKMTGLTPNGYYTYSIGSDKTVYDFQAAPANTRTGGKMYAVLADFGYTNDVSLDEIKSQADAKVFDTVILSGDQAYDFQTTKGAVGNSYMNAITPIASKIPWMTARGNHEAGASSANSTHYSTRFHLLNEAAKNSNSDIMWHYSFNDDLVHFIVIDTELYYYCTDSTESCKYQIDEQLEWIKKDLESVDRTKTPWIIASGHKNGFWMDSIGVGNFSAIASLLSEYDVDLYLTGHQHSYIRTKALGKDHKVIDCLDTHNSTYKDCKGGFPSLVVGSPGCREKLSTGSAGSYTVVQHVSYGYGNMQVVNSTHLHFQFLELPSSSEGVGASASVKDDVWIIRS